MYITYGVCQMYMYISITNTYLSFADGNFKKLLTNLLISPLVNPGTSLLTVTDKEVVSLSRLDDAFGGLVDLLSRLGTYAE